MKRIRLFTVFVGLIMFLVMFSLIWSPQKATEYVPNNTDITFELKATDAVIENNCNIDPSGTVTVTDKDPYLVFPIPKYYGNTIVLRMKENAESPISGQLYIDYGNGFREADSIRSFCPTGSKYICFELPDGGYFSLRLDIDVTYKFDALEFHSEAPILKYTRISRSIGWYFFAVIIAFLTTALAYWLDKKYNISKRIAFFFSRNYRALLKGLAALGGICIISIPAEWILGHFIFGVSTDGHLFNIYRYLFICCFLFSWALFLLCRKSSALKVENLFLGILLASGIMMILTAPVAHVGWDVNVHYDMARKTSYLGKAYVTPTDIDVYWNHTNFFVKGTGAEYLHGFEQLSENYGNIVSTEKPYLSLPHLPSGIFMAVARALGCSFGMVFRFGEMANLLLYALLCYFAIKKLKSGRMILAIIALFPTNILIASTYSYDYWVTGFSLLGMAYFIGECQETDKYISVKNTFIMCGSFALACIPKQIYIPLLLIPFFMPWKKIENKKKYYIICTFLILLLFVSLLSRTVVETTGTGDLRGGSDVNPADQIAFILSQPMQYVKLLFRWLKDYLSFGNTSQYITNFANCGVAYKGYAILAALLIFTAITDKSSCDLYVSNWKIRCYTIAMYFGEAVLLGTAFYLVFTAVGAETIAGCQARYMMPLLFPLLSVIGTGRIRNNINRSIYNQAILAICTFIIFRTYYMTILVKMF
ncbi:MAG: DUF2142 domain-containing protein [Lachnospiraceae bacterium]|nr:DUF2142 domain-containing protein [Lachnospiraceae bacterium]